MALPLNATLLATKYTRYSLFLKYEKSKLAHLFSRCIVLACFFCWSLDSSFASTFGSNEHDKIQVKNTIPAMDMKVILHEVLFNRACMMGPITNSPAPGPVTASPVTKERLLMKYLCRIIKTTKNTQDDPNP